MNLTLWGTPELRMFPTVADRQRALQEIGNFVAGGYEAALRRNVGPRQQPVGSARVAPGGAPLEAELAKMRAKLCDRLVLVGEPDLVDRTLAVTSGMGWEVPLLCADGMLSAAATEEAMPDNSWITLLTVLIALAASVEAS